MAPGDPVPAAVVMLVSCVGGYAVSFKETKKKGNGISYPATTLRSLLAAIQ